MRTSARRSHKAVQKEPSPVRNTNTRSKEQLETTAQSPSDLLGRHFGRENGNQHGRRADPQTTNNATDIKNVQTATVNHLHDTADLENGTGHNQRPATTKPLGNGPDDEATEERTGLEDADGVGVDGDALVIGVVERVLERREREDAADDTGVVGKEEGTVVVLVECLANRY